MDIKVKHGNRIAIIDDKTGTRSPEGNVFEIDYGTVTVTVNGERINFDGETMKGKTVFGPCTLEVV